MLKRIKKMLTNEPVQDTVTEKVAEDGQSKSQKKAGILPLRTYKLVFG